jgi:hypothetical protein
MTKVLWDQSGERHYETGVDRGVLYIPDNTGAYVNGYAWNGLTTVTESPSGAEATPQYADNIKYLNLYSYEEFGGTVEAFTYPAQFAACDGSLQPEAGVLVGQQPRQAFGMAYRTRLGNDLEAAAFGYKLHLLYGLTAAPSEKAYTTINDSPEAISFSWAISSTPVLLTSYAPVSSIVIDSTQVDAGALADLEDFLYGTVGTDPSLPAPADVLALFSGTVTTTATPTAPAYNSTTDVVTIPTITGVNYYDQDGTALVAGSTHTITADHVYTARPATGYKFPAASVDAWLIVFV